MKKKYIFGLSILALSFNGIAQDSDSPIYKHSNPINKPKEIVETKEPMVSGNLITPCDSGSVNLYSYNSLNWSSDSLGMNIITTNDSLTSGMLYNDSTFYLTYLEGDSLGELVLPAEGSTFSNNVRGYYFTAPVDFVITGLRVPTTASSGPQNIAILRFPNSAPPLWNSTTNDFIELGYWANYMATDTIYVNIPVFTGDIIGIYGNRDDINSYAPAPATTTIGGISTTLTRTGMQLPLSSNPMQNVFSESSGSISRVDMYYDLTPDTLITALNVTVPQSYSLNETAYYCFNDSVQVNGTYFSSDTIFTINDVTVVSGCDSITTYTISLNTIDVNVSQNGVTLTADQSGSSYVWLDCNNGNLPIPSETNQSYTPTVNGDYSVIITNNGCSDTSACYTVSTIGLTEDQLNPNVLVYPNPTKSDINIDFGFTVDNVNILVYDMVGKLVYSTNGFTGQKTQLPIKNLSNGAYTITVKSDNFNTSIKFIKE